MIFFAAPMIVLILAAILPAVFLVIYVYRMDKIEKEPPALIIRLLMVGAISTILATISERIGMFLLYSQNSYPPHSVTYRVILYFIIVGLSEEGFKYMTLKRETWRSPFFNCQFDAVVYAVTVSLGFALWENILYVFSFGLRTAFIRAVTAVPGHACFGVFMGAWYGYAKRYYDSREDFKSIICRIMAIVIPTCLHGAYDYIATAEEDRMQVYFIIFIAIMFTVSYLMVNRLSRNDKYTYRR
jgi:RsiW-degrading membrane proteinase PrsW (M82 family)